MTVAAVLGLIFGLPEAPTALFIVALCVVIGYSMYRDRSAFKTQQDEIADLRASTRAQADRHERAMARVDEKLELLQAELKEQHSLKHKFGNDVTATVNTLYLVRRLARECTCDRRPLEPLIEIIDGVIARLETMRPSDPFVEPEEGT